MSEQTSSSAPATEDAKKESVPAPAGKNRRKLWIAVIAVIVVAALIGSSLYVFVFAGLKVSMKPDELVVDAGKTITLSVTVKKGMSTLTDSRDVEYRWALNPDTLGSFNLRSKPTVNLTAGKVGGTGTVSCTVTYKGEKVTVSKPITVNPPYLDQILIAPSTKTLDKGMSAVFTATAIDSVADPIFGLEFTWAVSGTGAATLNRTTGVSVTLTAGDTYGPVNLTATATYRGVTKTGYAAVTIGPLPPRSAHYVWYDMFNVPFGEWWYMRYATYHIEEPITNSYPYLFKWHGQPAGNDYIYSNMRLNMTGRNISEVNMNERPEFLPLHGNARGGTAVIDWYMQYLTSEEMKRYPDATAGWNDGWVVALYGTVTLDKQAALSVIKGLTSEGYDNFASWWAAHGAEVERDFSDWFQYEAGKERLDIYPMYDAEMQILTWNLDAKKVGDKIVLYYDSVSWGMEALMTRWMHETFLPTEWYFEDMDFHMTIGPEWADFDIDTAVAYAVYAYETTLEPGVPCWVWEALMQDYVGSSPPEHPHSDFDAYEPFEYLNTAPGSYKYNEMMPYDYTPGVWNLSENETLTFIWPAGEQLFKVHVDKGVTGDWMSDMVCVYAEPMPGDNVGAGSVTIDNDARRVTYTGPIDMWNWSRTQTTHEWLKSEWERMGILPYGAPYVEWKPAKPPARWPASLELTVSPELPLVGTTATVTVRVLDQYGALYPGYNGTITFSSNRSDVDLPADYTFTVADSGVHTFNITFHGLWEYNVSARQVDNASIAGWTTDIYVIPEPEVIDHFEVSVPGIRGIVLRDQPTDVYITAYNQYGGRVFKSYSGTVEFSTDAPAGTYTLPAPFTFSPDMKGSAVVHGLIFSEPGVFNLTVYDRDVPTAKGTATGIRVAAAIPSIDYRIYDMFEEPWGEWWQWRLAAYKTDIILSNKPHEYTMVYNPDMRNRQGIIMAPYRWNTTARNVSTVNVHSPEFMPVLGTPDVPGAEARMRIYFQYLNHAWWDTYWVPTWSSNWNWSSAIESLMTSQESDGYYLGVLYDVVMNRAAAEEWLGMPQTADPVAWWNANRAAYMQEWQRWINYEGNVRLDIWPGYEWPYIDLGTMMNLVVEPSGDVRLQIAHFNWGYEVLMTRWLNETGICTHEPYMEDFHFNATLTEDRANVAFDAVAQYNLHAVKANQTAMNPAWVWEPQRIDYVYYEGATRNSEFNPWDGRTYTSWNSGDMFLGQEVGYDFTPTWFNLTSYMTLTIELPNRPDVVGYQGVALPYGSIARLKSGDTSAYDSITVHGSMWLGYVADGTPDGMDLSAYYDNETKVLRLRGPMSFDNFRHADGLLYHSAPWIEFNVENKTTVTGLSVPSSPAPSSALEGPAASASSSAAVSVVGLAALALSVVVFAALVAVSALGANLRRR